MGASKPASAAHSEQDPLSEALDIDPDEYEWVREQLETAGIQLQSARLEDGGDDDDDADDDDDEDGGGGGAWTDPSPGGALGELLELLDDGDDGQQDAEDEQLLAKVDALLARLAPPPPPAPAPPPANGQPQHQPPALAPAPAAPPGPLLVSLPGPDGDSALHLCALYGRAACARRLLDAGADAGAVNPDDGTLPLHDAAAGGHDAIVALLLERGAAGGADGAGGGGGGDGAGAVVAGWLARGDEDGDTPLHCAARGGHLPTVLRLLAAGADASRANERGATARDESDDDQVRALLARVAEKGGGGEGAGGGGEAEEVAMAGAGA